MAYVQHTHCVPSGEFRPLSAGIIAAGGVFFVLGMILAAVGGGPIGVIVALGGGLTVVNEVCRWLLGGKLICLGHNQCAIGLVVGLEPPGYNKDFPENIDNDYSVNILLAPHFFYDLTAADVEKDGVQGRFIAEQWQSKTHKLGFAGYPMAGVEHHTHFAQVPALHCEFEGDRIANVCTTLRVLVPALAVTSAFCAIPIIGWIICLIAALIAAITMAIVWAASGEGDPLDAAVTPEDGNLHIGTDYVIIRGDWCFDAGHEGWNEIHPIKSVQKIPRDWEETVPGKTDRQPIFDAFKLRYQFWCEATGQASSAIVQVEQKEPPNRWWIHPIVDGCHEEDPVPPIPVPH